jgi:hypothetical protein
MGSEKKKGSAEASANPKQEKYNKLRKHMQDGTHVSDLFDYLYRHDTITPMECFWALDNTRISSTVSILRHDYGVPVDMVKTTKNGRTYGVYSIDWEVLDV